jgi:hypothetical protein
MKINNIIYIVRGEILLEHVGTCWNTLEQNFFLKLPVKNPDGTRWNTLKKYFKI